jgi:hypothetical protein
VAVLGDSLDYLDLSLELKISGAKTVIVLKDNQYGNNVQVIFVMNVCKMFTSTIQKKYFVINSLSIWNFFANFGNKKKLRKLHHILTHFCIKTLQNFIYKHKPSSPLKLQMALAIM